MKENERKILDYLAAHKEDMVDDLVALASAQSPTCDKRSVDECGRVLARLYRERLGAVPQVVPQKDVGDCLVTEVGAGTDVLMIAGHFDTVHPTDSVPLRREGDVLFGPGVTDMKGGDVMAIWAVKALIDLGFDLDKKVRFVNNSDEETGSVHSRELLLKNAAESFACIVPEPATCPDGLLKTCRKGDGKIRIKCYGRAAHSGNAPQGGVNANVELAHQIIFIQGLSDYGETGSTFSPNIISGGAVDNVVSDYAEGVVDWRLCVPEEIERVKKILDERKPVLPGSRVEFEINLGHPPLAVCDRNLALLSVVKGCASDLDMKIEAAPMVGGCSDGNDISNSGVPTIDGMGMVGNFIHNPNEQAFLDHLVPRTALMASFILRVKAGN